MDLATHRVRRDNRDLHLGPTEFRLAVILINALLVEYGTRKMVNGLKYVNIGAAIVLAVMVYNTHKTIWEMDMKEKKQAELGQ